MVLLKNTANLTLALKSIFEYYCPVNSLKNNGQSISKSHNYERSPWLYFLGAVFLILVLSPLFQKGCFIDGMLYKTVAYNYAEGLSSFWRMKFTNTSMSEFCEQPPLYFYLLGSFYKVFGDYYLVDRFFTLLLFVLFIFILRGIIKELFRRPMPYLLVSVFFVLSIPVFCWSYVNQAIEPLLCVLTSLGILFFLRFVHSGKNIFSFLFAVVLYLLFLTKGFQSCFIAVLPLVYAVISKVKRDNYYFFIFSGVIFLALLAVCLRFYSPAANWFKCYYNARLVLTLNNVGNTTDNHLEIIGRFFSELILCLASLVILFSCLKIKKNYPIRFILKNFMSNRIAVSFLLTSFAGSFPYAISLVQRGFYLIPSFIFFILAMVYGFKRYWFFFFAVLMNLQRSLIIKGIIGLVVLGAILYCCFNFNTYKRNEELLTDIELILPYFKKGDTIGIEEDSWNDFSLHSYLYMAKQVSLTTDKKNCSFLIRSKSFSANDSLIKIEIKTRELDLYLLPK